MKTGFLIGLVSILAFHWVALAGQVQTQDCLRSPIAVLSLCPLKEVVNPVHKTTLSQMVERIATTARPGGKPTLDMLEAHAAELEQYTKDFPDSPYSPVIAVDLARFYRNHGRYSRVLNMSEFAWNTLKREQGPKAAAKAEEALVQYGDLLASLGRESTLRALLKDVHGRVWANKELASRWREIGEASTVMRIDPGISFRCGAFALGNVVLELTGKDLTGIATEPSSSKRFSLAELERMAARNGASFTAVQLLPGGSIPVPSVVHWKENHYAAILRWDGNFLVVADPTFGNTLLLRPEAILDEASGYFVVPSASIDNQSMRKLTVKEAEAVYGKGYNAVTPAGDDGGSCEDPGAGSDPAKKDCPECGPGGGPGSLGSGTPGGGGPAGGGPPPKLTPSFEGDINSGECCGSIGMPVWRVSQPFINLWMFDSPLVHQTAKGEPFRLGLKYKQRGPGSIYNPGGSFGSLWRTTWMPYVDGNALIYDSGIYLGTVKVHTPDGRQLSFTFTSGNPNTTAKSPVTGEWMTKTESGDEVTSLALHARNGSAIFFARKYYTSFLPSYKYESTAATTTWTYDTGSDNPRVLTMTLADDEVITFNYNHSSISTLVTSVSSTTSGTASFTYTSGYDLESITDTAGMTSSFVYDGSGRITSLVTPYGTTTFSHHDNYPSDPDASTHDVQRRIGVTQPNTDKWLYALYRDVSRSSVYAVAPAAPPSGELPSGHTLDTTGSYLHVRSTFVWGPAQVASLSTENPASMTSGDFLLARMSAWLYDADKPQAISFVRDFAEHAGTAGSAVFYDYPGKPSTIRAGSSLDPSLVARLQPDGSARYEKFTRNSLGFVTEYIERWLDGSTEILRTNKYVWNSGGDLLSVHTGPDGKVVRGFGYDIYAAAPMFPKWITNAVGEVTILSHRNDGSPLTVEHPSGQKFTYSYAGNYTLASIIETHGSTPVSTNLYSETRGVSFSRANLVGGTDSRTVRQVIHTDPRNLVVTNRYDELGRILEARDARGVESHYYELLNGETYSSSSGSRGILGRTLAVDRLGSTNRWQYDPMRRPIYHTDSRGFITSFDYCDCGGVEQVRRAFGTTDESLSGVTFSIRGRKTYEYPPAASPITNSFDSIGRQVGRSDSMGSTTLVYDNLDRLILVANGAGVLSSNRFDLEGRVLASTDSAGVTTTNRYDSLNRVIATGFHQTNSVIGLGYGTGQHRPTYITNAVGNVTLIAYDAASRKTNEIHGVTYSPSYAAIDTNQFRYSPGGDLIVLSDGKAQITRWVYDIYGQVIHKTNQVGSRILGYAYDAAGRMTNRWSAEKGTTGYSYDSSGNLTNVDYPSSTDLRYKYDALSRMTNMVDAVGTTKHSYDIAGRMLTEDGPWSSDTVTYTYTNGLRWTLALQQPSGSYTQAYWYDAAKRLTNTTATSGKFGYGYHAGASRQIKSLALPNTAVITNAYDPIGRWTKTHLRTSGGTLLNGHDYQYDAGHRRTKQTYSNASYVNYGYDRTDQLTSAFPYDSGNTLISADKRGYLYDPAGNLKPRTNNAALEGFTVDVQNQLTSEPSGSSPSYDANGNLIVMPGPTIKTADYDSENQLVQVNSGIFENIGSSYSTCQYDGKMRLRSIDGWRFEEIDPGNYGWVQHESRKFIYDGMEILQERISNSPVATYTRGLDLRACLRNNPLV